MASSVTIRPLTTESRFEATYSVHLHNRMTSEAYQGTCLSFVLFRTVSLFRIPAFLQVLPLHIRKASRP